SFCRASTACLSCFRLSCFRDELLTLVSCQLGRQEVGQLFSPPAWPQYNGSCEAGIGSIRTRTHHQSARRGFPGQWTCDDMEAARLQANELARPWGLTGMWEMKPSVTVHDTLTKGSCVPVAERHGSSSDNAGRLGQGFVRHDCFGVARQQSPLI